ncbi:hypothetical protein ANN_04133 [Periplaneta americana]|uniref:Uncharacterized protein n=1 Tax=Periplaneta americana TaxID=6978 RepID=A0ABQ8T9A3_PERAM|nr:hypothetical protein ANN_04133 [Periplaneta americana]
MAGLCEGGNEPPGSLIATWPAEVVCKLKMGHNPAISPQYAEPVSRYVDIATGVALSAKALACRSRVAFGRGIDSRLG